MEIKSRICRAPPASAASHRTPSRCRCPTSSPLAHSRSAPGFLSRGTALSAPRWAEPPPAGSRASTASSKSWVGVPGALASRTWLPLRYQQQQPQHASTARGWRGSSVPSPPPWEGGGGRGRGDSAGPAPPVPQVEPPPGVVRLGPLPLEAAARRFTVPPRGLLRTASAPTVGSGPAGARLQGLVRRAKGRRRKDPRTEGPPGRAAASPATSPGAPRHWCRERGSAGPRDADAAGPCRGCGLGSRACSSRRRARRQAPERSLPRSARCAPGGTLPHTTSWKWTA